MIIFSTGDYLKSDVNELLWMVTSSFDNTTPSFTLKKQYFPILKISQICQSFFTAGSIGNTFSSDPT